MKELVSVDPFRCRMWQYHDRLEQDINESSCRTEIDSVFKHGQLVPVLGRTLRVEPDYDVELIYGARRLFVARHLRRPLLVEVRNVTDAEAIVAMDIENRHRLDISPYERGRSYLNYLRANLFSSQDEIARELKISASQVSRLIKLAQLPTVVVAAFKSPADICESWAHDLSTVLEDPQCRASTCNRARVISKMSARPEPREILRQILNASTPRRKLKTPRHDEVVTGRNGTPLFRIRHLSNAVALVVPLERLPTHQLVQIRAAMANLLDEEGSLLQANALACSKSRNGLVAHRSSREPEG
ncbi:MAG TPA: ParB/RepB/Spo0J family partition protein [Steroidobacteraceae bacterium]|nr:ParB/RepB/Spo0J family partition protein [Steroidobacteraceae bacterium]